MLFDLHLASFEISWAMINQKIRSRKMKLKVTLKVPLTPRIFFRFNYEFPFSPDHHCKKTIVVAIFVNFLRIFKVYNFARFIVHD